MYNTRMKTIRARLENGCLWRLEDNSLHFFGSPVWIEFLPEGEYYILLTDKNQLVQVVPV